MPVQTSVTSSCTAYVTGGEIFQICMGINTRIGCFSRNKVRQFNAITENRYVATKIVVHKNDMGYVFILDYLKDAPLRCH